MKTSKSKTAVVILFAFSYSLFCQAPSGSINEPVYHWNLTVTGGITYNIDDRLNNHTSLNYLEYGAGYFINANHEIGIKIGRNDFISNPFVISDIRYTQSDTVVTYGTNYGLNPDIWYGMYYRLNYHSWFGGVLFAGLSGFSFEYTSFSLGRQIEISSLFFISAGINFSLKTHQYKYINAKHLSLTASLSVRL